MCLKSQLHIDLCPLSREILCCCSECNYDSVYKIDFSIGFLTFSPKRVVWKGKATQRDFAPFAPYVCNWCVCNVISKSIYIIYGKRVKWSGSECRQCDFCRIIKENWMRHATTGVITSWCSLGPVIYEFHKFKLSITNVCQSRRFAELRRRVKRHRNSNPFTLGFDFN